MTWRHRVLTALLAVLMMVAGILTAAWGNIACQWIGAFLALGGLGMACHVAASRDYGP